VLILITEAARRTYWWTSLSCFLFISLFTLITFIVYAQECTTCGYGIVLLYNCVLTSAYRLPLPFTTPQSTDFKYPRLFICIRSYSYCLSSSLFITAATAIEAWVEIYRCQISDLSSEVKNCFPANGNAGRPKLRASLRSFFISRLGVKRNWRISLIYRYCFGVFYLQTVIKTKELLICTCVTSATHNT
jgi:hypothetical protein